MIASNYKAHFFCCWCLRLLQLFKFLRNYTFFFYREVALVFLRTSTHLIKSILEVLLEHLRVRLDESKLEALVGLKMINMNFYPICPDPDLTVWCGSSFGFGNFDIVATRWHRWFIIKFNKFVFKKFRTC